MTKAKFATYILAGLVVLSLFASSASAQSTISGEVRDGPLDMRIVFVQNTSLPVDSDSS